MAVRCGIFRTFAIGLARLKRTSTSFVVACIRVFGLGNFRVAFEASFVSRKRFGMCAIALKTSSERIVSSWALKADVASIARMHLQCQNLVRRSICDITELRSVVRG